MQLSLALDAASPLPTVYGRLSRAFGSFREGPRLSPIDQLIRAMIGGRTYDEVAWSTFLRLKSLFHPWERLLEAPRARVEQTLAPVTHAEIKAGWLQESLARIRDLKGGLDLAFLCEADEAEAMAWLRTNLPGVGDHVAAAVLNFSTLRRRAMVVETHVWRVARRIGLAARNADPEGVRRALTEAAPAQWTDEDFFDLHWLLKRLGQTLCQDHRTRCGACPVAELCEERRRALSAGTRTGHVLALPRAAAPARPRP